MSINTDFARPRAEQIAKLSAFPTPTLYEALGQRGAAPSYIRPIFPGMKIAGAALTIDCPPHDNLSIHAAVAQARRGDVLVVDYKGFLESGPFGDILATACQAAGIGGLAIDGCVRDAEELREMGFSVFARGLCIKSASKTRMGQVGSPILFAGIPVMPGDAVIGDEDGLVIIPRGEIDAVIHAAQLRDDKEAEMRDQLRSGATTVDLLNLARYIQG
jgi:4-hydroxy-4-methyl-2-oxoglutarate aldolase